MTTQRPSSLEPVPSRPQVPSGYGISKEPSPQMPRWSDVQERLRQARNYWIATSRPDGRPHVMPVWGLWQDDGFYFGTDPASRKGRNLAANPNASLHLESGDDVIIVEGAVHWVAGSPRLAALADAYFAKYQVRPDVTSAGAGLYRLAPATAFAWKEQDFPNTATRWRFPAARQSGP